MPASAVDGRRAVSASQDRTLRVWDVETGKTIAILYANAGVASVAWSGDIIAFAAGRQVQFLRVHEGTTTR